MCMKKTKFFFLFVVLCAGAVYADDGNAEILRTDIPQRPDLNSLNLGLELSFGNFLKNDYQFAGDNGQAYIKPSLEWTKGLGPVMLVSSVSSSIGLTSPQSSNLLVMSVSPLMYLPFTDNFLIGARLGLIVPFHEGRLIGDIPGVPANYPFPAIAQWEFIGGLGYGLHFDWGSIVLSVLSINYKNFTSNDWTVQLDPEFSFSSAIGLGFFVSPLFVFQSMGQKPDSVYSSLDVQLNYTIGPFSAMLTVIMPGAQEDGFKNFGVVISPRVSLNIPPKFLLNTWLACDIANVGNKVGNDISTTLKMGLKYSFFPNRVSAAETAGSPDAETADSPAVPEKTGGKLSRWHFGITGGYTNNKLYTSTAGRAYTEYENGHGFEIAIPFRYQIKPWLALQTELQYIQKNYTWKRTGVYDKVYTDYTNHFFDIPLMLNFSAGGEAFRVFANAGAYAGFWLGGKKKGTLLENTTDPFSPGDVFYSDYDEKAEFNKNRDARFDAGLLCGLGIQYSFKPVTIFLEGRYYYGLTDMQQNYAYGLLPKMNSTFNVRLGALLAMDFSRRGK